MKGRELVKLGIPKGSVMKTAIQAIAEYNRAGASKERIRDDIRSLVDNPSRYVDHPQLATLAKAMREHTSRPVPGDTKVPCRIFGENIDDKSLQQMNAACRLPVAVAGALMPDAHLGYGLPIGGVLATEGAVIPYAVGVDIACRMKLSVLDMPTDALQRRGEHLKKAIEDETSFGIGAHFKRPRQHPVMDEDWSISKITRQVKDTAREQLGTSGSGNHFVEFGILTVEPGSGLGLDAGEYLALLSHSGSRGPGNKVASHYSDLAMKLHRDLPKELRHLAWLDIDSEPGQEYWAAMQLMGRFASANHDLIHKHIAKHLGVQVLLDIENHHNFAWTEHHRGRDVIVHRKGATPASADAVGIIPGSMATPGFVVRGKGNEASLDSASHGAGRVMSRRQAKSTYRWNDATEMLKQRNVEVISAGLDEIPMVYKNIHEVMQAQRELVEVLARFDPRLVKMAPGGRAED